jgi:rubrerythrin
MFDVSPGELTQSKLLTPYRALASAVRHEERTFAFWTYVAAHAPEPEVKEAAERMALEELNRVALLRRERREAFHAQRISSGPIEVTVDVATLAREERRLAALIERNASLLPDDSELVQDIARASNEAAAKLESLSVGYHQTLSVPKLPVELSDDPLAVSELLVEAYLTLAEIGKNAEVVRIVQQLASAAIYRLATLRSGSDLGIETDDWQPTSGSAERKPRSGRKGKRG